MQDIPNPPILLQIGSSAPDFTLPAVGSAPFIHDGTVHLADLRGHWVVLYFYPKDDTPGCTVEACEFRDANASMQEQDIVVLGVSPDDLTMHHKFLEGQHLPFPLLSDTEKTMLQQYGVWAKKSMYGREYMGVLRTTYLIDPAGVIRHIWEKVTPKGHAQEVLEKVQALRSQEH